MTSRGFIGDAASQQSLSKEEIAWTFVIGYYEALGKDPAMVHRFYKKQSTLIYGNEGEPVEIFVGQRAIHDKIQSLGFKDCQVVVSTVESLESMNGGIIIQVLGELSNAGEPSQKFAQTIFLAPSQPPNGYFVLNNIFKYLKEDIDSDLDGIEPDSVNEIDTILAHEDQLESDRLTNGFHTASHANLGQEYTQISASLPPTPVAINSLADSHIDPQAGHSPSEMREIHPAEFIEKTSASVEPITARQVEGNTPETGSLEDESSPADDAIQAPPKQTGVAENALSSMNPANPVVKTWATLAATNSEKWQSQTEQKPLLGGGVSYSKNSGSQVVARKETGKVTHDVEKPEPALGYIKYVGPKVQKTALNDALIKFGALKDLDINRQKSCGFVEFSTHSALQAAIAASPLDLGENIKIIVEERRKSGKSAEGKPGRHLITDRRAGNKNEEGRALTPKKAGRSVTGSLGSHKARTD